MLVAIADLHCPVHSDDSYLSFTLLVGLYWLN